VSAPHAAVFQGVREGTSLTGLLFLAAVLSANKFSDSAGAGLGTNAGVDSEQDPRLLSSREFLRELGKGAGARKELSALSLRWINLRGLPHITAAFTYNK